MLNRYSLMFFLSGLGLARVAIHRGASDPRMLVFIYPSLSFFVLSIAYAGAGPAILGKRPDGLRAWWAIAWSLPYSLIAELVWRLTILLDREPPMAQVVNNLYCGRRLTRREQVLFEQYPIEGCLDLTAEFSERRFLREVPLYHCHPLLDGTAPTVEQLHELVEWLVATISTTPVYVHCALGHGRTSTVLVAFLIRNGLDPDIDSALSRLRTFRPGMNLNGAQQKLLNKYAKNHNNVYPVVKNN